MQKMESNMFKIQINTQVYYQMSEIERQTAQEAPKVEAQQAENTVPSDPQTHTTEQAVVINIDQSTSSISVNSNNSGEFSPKITSNIEVSSISKEEQPDEREAEETKTSVATDVKSEQNPNPVERSPEPLKIESQKSSEPQLVLSPRSSRRSPSPNLSKSKLVTLNNMIAKEQVNYADKKSKYDALMQEKLQLEKALNEKMLKQNSLIQKQEEQKGFQEQRAQLKSVYAQKLAELEALKQHKIAEQKKKEDELQKLTKENSALQQELSTKLEKQANIKNSYQQNLASAKDRLKAETDKLLHLNGNTRSLTEQREQLAKRIYQLQNKKKQALQEKAKAKESKEQQAKSEEQAKNRLQKKVQELKEKINSEKNKLEQVKSQHNEASKGEHSKINDQITRLKAVAKDLNTGNKKLQQDLNKKIKENSEAKEADKKKEKKIIDLTKKSEELNKKIIDLKQQANKLDSQKQQKKKVKYQQKIPEELIAIQNKTQTAKKQIKRINDLYEIEKAQMDKLVPPVVIQSMNKKISAVIATNEKINEITKIISQVSKENDRLAEQVEGLEWGQNKHLKDLETEKKKQEQKNKLLEEDIQSKKKQFQQLNNKIEEYVKEYPDFKPEKKKKPEPVVVQEQPKSKKEEKGKKGDKSPTVNEDKKKKGNKDAVVESKIEEKVEVKVQAKIEEVKAEEPKGKNKKKKTAVSQIQIKKQPSPPPIEVKVQKNKVAVIAEAKSEVKVEEKVEQKTDQNKPKKKKK